MSHDLENEILLHDIVPVEDLRLFERVFNEESRKDCLQQKTRFDYACCLVRSRFLADIKKGLVIMENLRETEESSNTNALRDYLYYLALGNTRIEKYFDALRYADDLLAIEPNNHQIAALKIVILKKMDAKRFREVARTSSYALLIGGIVGILLAIARMK